MKNFYHDNCFLTVTNLVKSSFVVFWSKFVIYFHTTFTLFDSYWALYIWHFFNLKSSYFTKSSHVSNFKHKVLIYLRSALHNLLYFILVKFLTPLFDINCGFKTNCQYGWMSVVYNAFHDYFSQVAPPILPMCVITLRGSFFSSSSRLSSKFQINNWNWI